MNADTRIYRAILIDGTGDTYCEIKGLAVKEKEIVVSHVQVSPLWKEVQKDYNEIDGISFIKNMSIHPEQQLTETSLIEMLESDENDIWKLENAITGEVLLEMEQA